MQSIALLLPLFLLPSCAAIVCQKTFAVPIDSVPQGAIVSYGNAHVGVTPCTVSMHRDDSHVMLRLDGYHEQGVDVGTATSAWIVGNVIFGGIIGLVVDIAGGATILEDGPVWVALTSVQDAAPGVWDRSWQRQHDLGEGDVEDLP